MYTHIKHCGTLCLEKQKDFFHYLIFYVSKGGEYKMFSVLCQQKWENGAHKIRDNLSKLLQQLFVMHFFWSSLVSIVLATFTYYSYSYGIKVQQYSKVPKQIIPTVMQSSIYWFVHYSKFDQLNYDFFS